MAPKALPSPEVLRQLLRYDPDTGRLFWRERDRSLFPSQRAWSTWNARYAGTEAFTVDDGYGYRQSPIFRRILKAHRVIWAMAHGAWPDAQIDHINGDKADNRLANLRPATNAQNMRNLGAYATNTSGHKGVTWHKRAGKWMAQITVDGKCRYLGLFADKNAAVEAYASASAEMHGEFGRVA